MGDKNTPTPWKVGDLWHDRLMIHDDHGKLVAEVDGPPLAGPAFPSQIDRKAQRERAALIVRAVNRDHLFGELVETLEEAAEAVNAYQKPALEKIRAVLAKVEEE